VITPDDLKKRKERLNDLAKGFLLDSSRLIRQKSPLLTREIIAYTDLLGDAFCAVSRAADVLSTALDRIGNAEKRG